MSVKDTNPKDAVGVRKAPLSALPWRVLWHVGLAMLEGALKYGRHNYRAAGTRASVYFDAIVSRHIGPWWEGEDIDPDSGKHHLDKAIAALMVLRDSMLEGNWVDDRPPRGLRPGDLDQLNTEAGALIDRYAGRDVHHYTIADDLAKPAAEQPIPVAEAKELSKADLDALKHQAPNLAVADSLLKKAVVSRGTPRGLNETLEQFLERMSPAPGEEIHVPIESLDADHGISSMNNMVRQGSSLKPAPSFAPSNT
ncbi:dATP/dGTP diphosphohydrolase domain-containing protein [Caldimonas sp. KR1-144]|uniref:dATP/dGTP diphosphohydrolase domain-containing protein n=1 Tax=Caldimonas sp. KR1-144 TaxID=3400911 RepID=UPI003C098EF8